MKTKKFFSLLFLSLFLAGLTSCDEDSKDKELTGPNNQLIGSWTWTHFSAQMFFEGRIIDTENSGAAYSEVLTFQSNGRLTVRVDGVSTQASYSYRGEELYLGAEAFKVLELTARSLVIERTYLFEDEDDYGRKNGEVYTYVNQLTYTKN